MHKNKETSIPFKITFTADRYHTKTLFKTQKSVKETVKYFLNMYIIKRYAEYQQSLRNQYRLWY